MPRTLTLAETLAGAERAAKRVERWPLWKREVSGLARIGTEGIGERDDEKIMTTAIDKRISVAMVAASAGYAHVPAAETDEETYDRQGHQRRLRLIEHHRLSQKGHCRLYAHTQPDAQLSGTRIDNGWAVSGFAVTDAVAQDRPAWTLADKQGDSSVFLCFQFSRD